MLATTVKMVRTELKKGCSSLGTVCYQIAVFCLKIIKITQIV